MTLKVEIFDLHSRLAKLSTAAMTTAQIAQAEANRTRAIVLRDLRAAAAALLSNADSVQPSLFTDSPPIVEVVMTTAQIERTKAYRTSACFV